MAAILPSDKPYLRTGVIETWKARLPWLMLLMLSATFTSVILTSFENALMAFTILTAFIPMLTGTGGNSGTQSSTAVIRALSLGEVEFSDLVSVIFKEIRVAVLCGISLAAANFIKMMVVDPLAIPKSGGDSSGGRGGMLDLGWRCHLCQNGGLCAAHAGREAGVRPRSDGISIYLHGGGCAVPADLLPVCPVAAGDLE